MTDPSTATEHPSSQAVAPPFVLDGKVAAVTGASSGIGQSVAVLLARQGARVFVLDVDAAGAAETVARISGASGEATHVTCDVASAAAVTRAFGEVENLAGRLDILVNNAGIAHIGNLARQTSTACTRSTSRACSFACAPRLR